MKAHPVLLSLLTSTLAAAQYGPILPAPQYKSLGSVNEVALGDWNADGRPDAVVFAVASSSQVAFLAGIEGGGFAPAVSIASVALPQGLVTGDVDGDGDTDVALLETSASPRRLIAFLSNGAGSFSAVPSVVPLAPDDTPIDLELADLDLDGDLDVVPMIFPEVVSSPDYRFGWLTTMTGDQSGSFAGTGAVHLVGQLPRDVAAGDFDGDGRTDAAVANNGSGDLSILLGDGTGGFGAAASVPSPAPGSPQTLALADFDASGSIDIAAGTSGNPSFEVHYGDGAGGFPTSKPFAATPGSFQIAAGDLNGDALPDLVAGNGSPTVLLNDGSGEFPAQATLFLPHAYSLALSDLDGDGRVDILVGGSLGLTLLYGDGSGLVDAPVIHASPAFGNSDWMEAADFDGDGEEDLVFDEFRAVRVRLGGGDGTFAVEQAPALLTLEPISAAIADLDGDGILDVAVSQFEFFGFGPAKHGLAFARGDGTGALAVSSELVLGQSAASVAAGDLDGDGDVELAVPLAANASLALPNQIVLYDVDGSGALVAGASVGLPGTPRDLAIADLDRDGTLDLATALQSGHVVVNLGTGAGSFASGVVHPLGSVPSFLRAADIDHDGWPDLVASSGSFIGASGVALMRGTGLGAFGPATFHFSQYAQVQRRPRVADMDGDGWLDVVVASSGIELWPGSSAGLEPSRVYAAWVATDTAIGDWDDDGFEDAAVLSYNRLSVHPNERSAPPGLAPFGTGTPGCAGTHLALGDAPPAIGTTMTLTCNHAPPLGLGLKVSSLGALDPGVLLLDMLVHVDPLSPILLINVVQADLAGLARFPVAIPFEPTIQGLVFHKQWFWLTWPALGCMPSASGFSSSRGLVFTIQ